MWKRRNKLYPNPDKQFEFPAGTKVIVTQPIFMIDKKIMVEAVVWPEFLHLQIAEANEKLALDWFNKIHKKILADTSDMAMIEEKDGKIEFLWHAFNCITSSYFWVDTYTNCFIERYITNKSDRELVTVQEKLNDLLPKTLKIDSFSKTHPKEWQLFLELEVMRNEIVHSKWSYFMTPGTDRSKLLLSKVLNKKFAWVTELCASIIYYYKDHEPKNNSNIMNIVERWLQPQPLK